jgi:hypothetical protein
MRGSWLRSPHSTAKQQQQQQQQQRQASAAHLVVEVVEEAAERQQLVEGPLALRRHRLLQRWAPQVPLGPDGCRHAEQQADEGDEPKQVDAVDVLLRLCDNSVTSEACV